MQLKPTNPVSCRVRLEGTEDREEEEEEKEKEEEEEKEEEKEEKNTLFSLVKLKLEPLHQTAYLEEQIHTQTGAHTHTHTHSHTQAWGERGMYKCDLINDLVQSILCLRVEVSVMLSSSVYACLPAWQRAALASGPSIRQLLLVVGEPMIAEHNF
ncbi:unnamed protein product [Protopolystoma xenopodis]|uniref:Uncharacterized protein n=1 Tax=Protopolystoma xenopodis TaxID=117903 RepID=A0A3S5CHV0_9PLAT|nr:unnamed protein product [Protopolystoma xenopodis]